MRRQVLIIWSSPLFRDTVRVLLDHSEVEVVDVCAERATRIEIENLLPDTIVFEAIGDRPDTGTEALRILEASPGEPRVIRLSLQDNELWACHRERQTVDEVEELVHLVLQE